LAGPVVAAAVVLPPGYALEGLTDSKKLSAAQRARLRARLEAELPPGSWAIGSASAEEIDKRNILRATYLAMHRAVAQLHPAPTDLLVDGNRFAPYPNIPHWCEVKGDARFACISAASIFAKTERDALMEHAHEQFPAYGWNVNKGYPTDAHRKALEAHGESPHHRKTFRWKPVQM
jgi:ribonuclease HII